MSESLLPRVLYAVSRRGLAHILRTLDHTRCGLTSQDMTMFDVVPKSASRCKNCAKTR